MTGTGLLTMTSCAISNQEFPQHFPLFKLIISDVLPQRQKAELLHGIFHTNCLPWEIIQQNTTHCCLSGPPSASNKDTSAGVCSARDWSPTGNDTTQRLWNTGATPEQPEDPGQTREQNTEGRNLPWELGPWKEGLGEKVGWHFTFSFLFSSSALCFGS